MRKFLKFALLSALVVFVGLPVAIVLCVVVLAAFGIAVGIGSAILGLLFAIIKIALMVILPIALIWFVVKKLLEPERTY